MRTPKWLPFACLSASLLILASFGARVLAADAAKGKRLAQSRCAPCHIVVPMQRQELSNSLPFDQIAKRNDINPETLAYLILGPHPRMNMSLSREEADDGLHQLLAEVEVQRCPSRPFEWVGQHALTLPLAK